MAKINLNEYLERLAEPEDRETAANRDYQRALFSNMLSVKPASRSAGSSCLQTSARESR